ncbi:hypothetical protein C8Q76DRAFT_789967 [Earliella scabrosa]|nr:hypothetical protein C8Q76DRAFT_789967 [Earliella scabrosa]
MSSAVPSIPLQFYWTSLLVNVVTPNECVCGYPSQTFSKEGALQLSTLTEKEEAAKAKYEDQGFRFPHPWWSIETDDPSNSTMDFFRAVNARGLTFQTAISEPAPAFPLMRTECGWGVKEPYPPQTVA